MRVFYVKGHLECQFMLSVRDWQRLFDFLVHGMGCWTWPQCLVGSGVLNLTPNVYLPSFSLYAPKKFDSSRLCSPTTSMSPKCCACHWSKVCKSSLQFSQHKHLKSRLPFPLAPRPCNLKKYAFLPLAWGPSNNVSLTSLSIVTFHQNVASLNGQRCESLVFWLWISHPQYKLQSCRSPKKCGSDIPQCCDMSAK